MQNQDKNLNSVYWPKCVEVNVTTLSFCYQNPQEFVEVTKEKPDKNKNQEPKKVTNKDAKPKLCLLAKLCVSKLNHLQFFVIGTLRNSLRLPRKNRIKIRNKSLRNWPPRMQNRDKNLNSAYWPNRV